MNINSAFRKKLYYIVVLILALLLLNEFFYVHPYNPGYGMLGPRWTYESTKSPAWWLLLFFSFVLISPLIRKQKIGLVGLALFCLVLIRPLIQNKFPQETAYEYFSKRELEMNKIVREIPTKNRTIINQKIKSAGFEKLIIQDSIYYFFFYDEGYAFGICYTKKVKLPIETFTFDRKLNFKKLTKNWYEFDYVM